MANQNQTVNYEYYYEELRMSYIDKVMNALEKRLANGSADLTLKNGVELLVCRKADGDIQIYDDEPNLIAEFSDDGYCGRIFRNGLFNAAVFIIRTSKRRDLW